MENNLCTHCLANKEFVEAKYRKKGISTPPQSLIGCGMQQNIDTDAQNIFVAISTNTKVDLNMNVIKSYLGHYCTRDITSVFKLFTKVFNKLSNSNYSDKIVKTREAFITYLGKHFLDCIIISSYSLDDLSSLEDKVTQTTDILFHIEGLVVRMYKNSHLDDKKYKWSLLGTSEELDYLGAFLKDELQSILTYNPNNLQQAIQAISKHIGLRVASYFQTTNCKALYDQESLINVLAEEINKFKVTAR